jgi:hypothetical protein
LRGEKERGEEGEHGGFIGEVLMAIYSRNKAGSNLRRGFPNQRVRGDLREEEEGSDGWDPLGGEREEGCSGLGWSGIWAGWFPGVAQVSCCLLLFNFFSSVFFFFYFLKSVLGFEYAKPV